MFKAFKPTLVTIIILSLLAGCSGNSTSSAPVSQSGANLYLWRASLDTLDFMPLQSADPRGGVIITEWYSPAQTPDERFKAIIYILDSRLRADGVNVSIFRNVKQNGIWLETSVDSDTESQIENAILMRAREMKVQGLG